MAVSVAIIEDNKDIRESLVILINGSGGFECSHAFPDAESAMREIPALQPNVVLVDINLPGESGINCITKLKPACPSTQFMVCTVFEDEENIFNALKAGATGYVLKNTAPARLLEAILEIYNGGSPMSSQIARRVVASFSAVSTFPSEIKQLTAREQELLHFLSKGFRYKEIADRLGISLDTVRSHVRNIYEKLQVQSRTEAINKVFPRH